MASNNITLTLKLMNGELIQTEVDQTISSYQIKNQVINVLQESGLGREFIFYRINVPKKQIFNFNRYPLQENEVITVVIRGAITIYIKLFNNIFELEVEKNEPVQTILSRLLEKGIDFPIERAWIYREDDIPWQNQETVEIVIHDTDDAPSINVEPTIMLFTPKRKSVKSKKKKSTSKKSKISKKSKKIKKSLSKRK